jgi:hypothetical protein
VMERRVESCTGSRAAGEAVACRRDFGRREGSMEEVRGNNAAIWTVRDQKVARAEFCPQRSEAFAAVGLAE